jgi:hypothetical protein
MKEQHHYFCLSEYYVAYCHCFDSLTEKNTIFLSLNGRLLRSRIILYRSFISSIIVESSTGSPALFELYTKIQNKNYLFMTLENID